MTLRELKDSIVHPGIRKLKKFFGMTQITTISKESLRQIYKNKWQRAFYKQKYGTQELISKMQKLGMQEGSCVFVQCSWNSFFNYTGNPKELIEGILEVIGPTGTLAMPAFPYYLNKPLDLKKSITGAGLLAEMFRRYPGVKRSINVQHSVCAIGPLSDYLLSEHHLCDTCWDKKSPYYRLSEVNALIFCLGVGYSFLSTSYHCAESINNGIVPYYTDFFAKEKTPHYYVDYDGITKEYLCYDLVAKRHFMTLPEKWFLHRHFTQGEYATSRISNLTILVYYADKYIPRLVDLARIGVDAYRSPSKKGYKFEKA